MATKNSAVKKAATKNVATKPVATKQTAKTVVAKQTARPVAAALPIPEKAKKVISLPNQKMKSAGYRVGNYVVYPTHGVGQITAEETQKIGDIELRVFVITFEKDKMTLRVPVHRAEAAGLRNISSQDDLKKAFVTLKGRARTSRGMWSRRAQEYEAKINSGCIVSVAEVVRDLHKNVDQSERSYSERMIYESAFSRLVGELAAAEKIDTKAAADKLIKILRQQAVAA